MTNEIVKNKPKYSFRLYSCTKVSRKGCAVNEDLQRSRNAYFGTYTESELSQKLRYNISEAREPVLIAGISKGNDSNGSKLPGYPNEDIGHWIVAYRVAWDTEAQSVSRVHYRDPAKSDAVSWSGSISATADTDLTRMYKFSLGLGIIS